MIHTSPSKREYRQTLVITEADMKVPCRYVPKTTATTSITTSTTTTNSDYLLSQKRSIVKLWLQ